jgi:hypothetical protein
MFQTYREKIYEMACQKHVEPGGALSHVHIGGYQDVRRM